MSQNRIQRSLSLATQVYNVLRENITTGRLAPGERIVIDRLAEQLGVSAIPVREAVARLVQENLITEGPNRRLQVIALSEQYVRDTFLVRSVLEGLAAELAAPRISEVNLVTLRQLLAETAIALAEGGFDVYVRADASLHGLVAEAADNIVLTSELHSLQPHIDLIRSYSQRNTGIHLQKSHQEHLQILEALENRDAMAARQAMEQHIRNASARIVQLIDFRAKGAPEVVD